MICIFFWKELNDEIRITKLHITMERRRQGLGERAVQHVIERAKEKGISKISTNATDNPHMMYLIMKVIDPSTMELFVLNHQTAALMPVNTNSFAEKFNMLVLLKILQKRGGRYNSRDYLFGE